MLGREVKIIHRSGDVEIGVRVKAVDEGAALVAKVAFDLEIRVEAIGDGAAILQVAPEFAMQRRFGEISDVGRHAGDGQAADGVPVEAQITSAAPLRVGHDRLPTDFVKRDVLRGVPSRPRDRYRGKDALRVAGGPLQDLHAAHRSADYTE